MFSSPEGREELKKKRVLIVEDDEIFRRFLKDHLSGKPGLEIVGEAEDGRKALEQAEALKPDLVLMDSRMPKLNGFKASRLLLEKMPHLRIIILDVFNHLKDKQAAEECGACGYVQKLNVLEDLLPAIRAAFRKNRDRKTAKKVRTGGKRKILRKEIPPRQRGFRLEQADSAFPDRELFLAGILDSIQDGISVLDLDFTILQVNRTMEDLYARAQPLAGKKCYEAYHLRKTACDICPTRKTLLTSKAAFEVVPKVGPGGKGVGWLGLYSFPFMDQASGRMMGVIEYVRDITEQKRAEEQVRLEEARLQSLYNISRYRPKDMRDLWDFALQEAISLTGSQGGWLGAYRADRQTLNVIAWSREIMTDSRIKDRPTEFPVEKGGIWAEAIRSGEPLVVNDYKADDPRKKGYPPGHLELTRFLAIPVLSEDKAAYLVVAANKEQDYDATDIRQLTLLMDSVLKITERKKAEEALRESEETYRTLVENLNEAIFSLDLEGRLTYISPAIELFSHFQAIELIGRQFAQYVHPDDLPGLQERFQGVLQGEIKSYEYRLIDKGGGIIHVRSHSRPIYKDGRPMGITGLLEDISERRRAEEATHLANERLQFLMSSASAAIYSSKAEGHFPATFISQGIIRMTGHEPEEFLKNPDFWYAHIHPEDRSKVDTELPKLFEKDSHAYEYRFQGKDGKYIWVRDEMRLIRDNKGHPLEIIGLCSDINEGKRAEEALQRSEEKYRELVENLNEVIYTIKAEGTITYLSPTVQAVLGYAPAELIGTDFALLLFPDDLDRIRGAFGDVLRGRLYPSEYRMFTKSGEVRWVRTSSRPVYEGGRAVGLQGVLIDITEHKRAEEQIRYQAGLLAHVTDAVISTDLQLNIRYWNAAAEVQYGWTAEEVLGKPLRDFLQNEYPHVSRDSIIQQVLEKGFWKGEVIQTCRDGTRFPALSTVSLVRDGQGQPVGHIAVNRDVTERKQAEEALQKSEKKFRALIEHSQDAVTMIAADGTILYDSPSLVRVLGYAPTERLGRKVFEFAHPDDRSHMMLGFAQFALKPGSTMSYQGRFVHKDGTVHWFEGVRANLLPEPFVQAIVVNYRDITERMRAEEALRESEERFRTLFENATIGIYRTAPEGRILLANPTLVRMLGYSSFKELEQRDLESEGFAPEFPRSRFHLMIKKEGEVRGLESAWKRADGKVIYVRESAKAICDAGGQILYYEGTVEDITERRWAEEALRLSGEQYQNLVESLNEVMISVNLEGKLDYVSPAVERITKYKVSELMGQPFARYVHPDDLLDLNFRFSEGLKGETRPYVFRILDKDGETKFFRTHSRPIMIEGKPAGLTGLLEDVTKRMRAEEALIKSEERFKLLFAFAPDAYFLFDLQGRLLDSNNAAQVITGHKKEESVGRTFLDLHLLPTSQQAKAAGFLEKNIMGLPTGPDEMGLSRQDGTEVQAEIRTFPIKVEGEIQILWIARDIAERKAMENEAEKRMTELEEFYKMAVNRELRMIELKSEIEKLTAELARLTGGLEKRA